MLLASVLQAASPADNALIWADIYQDVGCQLEADGGRYATCKRDVDAYTNFIDAFGVDSVTGPAPERVQQAMAVVRRHERLKAVGDTVYKILVSDSVVRSVRRGRHSETAPALSCGDRPSLSSSLPAGSWDAVGLPVG